MNKIRFYKQTVVDLSGYIEAVFAVPLRSMGLGVLVQSVDDLTGIAEVTVTDAHNRQIDLLLQKSVETDFPLDIETVHEDDPAFPEVFEELSTLWRTLGLETVEPTDESFIEVVDATGYTNKIYLPEGTWDM